MAENFTWVPLYRELADCLEKWEDRQRELIDFLEGLRKEGCVISSLIDQDPPGTKFLLKEIDPFTFYGTFNRGIKDETRIAILKRMKEHFGAKSQLPTDFDGIPIVNNMSSWFIAYQFNRDPKDVQRLWKVFRLALGDDPLNSADFWAAFDEALKVRQTKLNLTMGLFWIRPEKFLNLDQVNRSHLNVKLPSSGLSSDFYRNTIATIAKTGKPFLEISREAWETSNDGEVEPVPAEPLKAEPIESLVSRSVETGPDTRYWAISLGEGGRLWNQCRKEGLAAIGWDYLGDLRNYADKEAIGKAMQEHEGDDSWWPTNNSLACYQFCHEMKKGDIVFAKQGQSTLLGCGVVTSDYEHQPARPEYRNVRHVDWINQASEEIPEEASVPLKTLTDITNFREFLEFALRRLVRVPAGSSLQPEYTIDLALKDLFVSEADFRLFLASLSRKKNAIIQGPPGVGKTFIARRLAYLLIGYEAPERVAMVQFH